MGIKELIEEPNLKELVIVYNHWLSNQLAIGGLVFTPEEWYDMKLYRKENHVKQKRLTNRKRKQT